MRLHRKAEPMTKHPETQPAANWESDGQPAVDETPQAADVDNGKTDANAEAKSASIAPSAFRYSIRTLIVVMLVAAGFAAWYGIRRQETQRQLDIVRPLKKMGAVSTLWEGDVVTVTFRGSPSQPFNPAAIKPLSQLPKLTRVVLIETACDAEAIRYLAELKSLEVLLIMSANLKDADLSPLTKLENLNTLWLTNSNLADESLDPLGKMRNLRVLNLNDNQLSDNGLMRLAELIELEQLYLSNCGITDNGVNLVKQTLLHVKIKREPFAADRQ